MLLVCKSNIVVQCLSALKLVCLHWSNKHSFRENVHKTLRQCIRWSMFLPLNNCTIKHFIIPNFTCKIIYVLFTFTPVFLFQSIQLSKIVIEFVFLFQSNDDHLRSKRNLKQKNFIFAVRDWVYFIYIEPLDFNRLWTLPVSEMTCF